MELYLIFYQMVSCIANHLVGRK